MGRKSEATVAALEELAIHLVAVDAARKQRRVGGCSVKPDRLLAIGDGGE
jgi:hypothetical protein